MKTTISLIITTLLIIGTFTSANAQKQDCIICPEMLGIITSTENGVNISTLTPNQNAAIILSNETRRAEKKAKIKSSKKANRQKAKLEVKLSQQQSALAENDDEIMGFADLNFSNDTKETLENCGCDGGAVVEETEHKIKVFTLYPNPAHHWVVINSKVIEGEHYKLFLKDAQGHIIKERAISESSTKLDLRSLKKGVYFVTLRNQKDFSTTVKKVTIQ